MSLVASVLNGDRLALSRILSQIENHTFEGQRALEELFEHTGRAYVIGVTGAPGTGKSTLVNQLARHYRSAQEGRSLRRVAVIAVDPSSPFSGGAIMGDRIRMRDLAGDPGVFIRSMASRGALGGLAVTTSGLVQALDAGGFEIILVETVGAGQVEVDIARLAHTTLVVEAPGLGDDVQAIKAGILEIADILVVNKADRPGAAQTEKALRAMLNLAHPGPRVFRHHGRVLGISPELPLPAEDGSQAIWVPEIVRTVATEGEGVPELAAAVERHYDHLKASGEWQERERDRMAADLDSMFREALVARWQAAASEGEFEALVRQLVARELSPAQAVDRLLEARKESV